MPIRPQRRALDPAPTSPALDAEPQIGATPTHWRVVEHDGQEINEQEINGQEIDGEATAFPNPGEQKLAHANTLPAIPDRPDEIIVAALHTRQLTVTPGESVNLRVALLNNGDRHACFQVQLEGWVDERWITLLQPDGLPAAGHIRQWLHPGEHSLLTLVIAPPRAAAATAGTRPIAVVVRAAEYGGRICRLGAQLTIQPYSEFTIGELRATPTVTSWRRRTAHLRLPITNGGNGEMELFVQAHFVQARFVQAHNIGRAGDIALRTAGKGWQPRRLTLTLPAGQTAQLIVRVKPPPPPLLSLRARPSQLRLAVGPVTGQTQPLAASVSLAAKPLIGLLPLAVCLLVLGMIAGGALLFTTLAATLATRASAPPAPASIAPAPAPQPQVVTIIVNLAQPAPTAAGDAPVPPLLTIDPNVPIVRLDQVTTPGEPVTTNTFRPAPAPAEAQWRPADPAGGRPSAPPTAMTYQQMFQDVALRYDLNWRVLAAQAYLESGFDALALGNSGDMGLMQIIPNTWREWAPQVEASDPFDAYSNTLVAAVYLDHLRSQLSQSGHSQIEWMLVAYNWGIDHLLTHLQAGGAWEDLPAERRQYATDILRIAETLPAE